MVKVTVNQASYARMMANLRQYSIGKIGRAHV